MAAAWGATLVALVRNCGRRGVLVLGSFRGLRRWTSPWLATASLLGGGALVGSCRRWSGQEGTGGFFLVLAQKEDVVDEEMAEKLSIRKQRFMQFASLEYEGEYYMTPRDFLFSVMFDKSERKTLAKKLTKKEVDSTLANVAKARPGPTFFRDLGDRGLISYTEYLFLLTILTKPQTGFRIAFKMLDADGNEQVEKKEFFKLQKIIGKQDEFKTASGDDILSQESEMEGADINTMLLVHFFGKGGKDKLQYSEFQRFMQDLQAEVQEMEFNQFSKGLTFMRKEDFVEWLLYFTDEENNEIYWQNVKKRIQAGESISMDEFKTFCQFTNHLEDFSIALKMFTVASRPVKRAEFKRAVKVATGQELSDNVLDTIFKIFDLDGDNCLSHAEFLGVLKNRMHRGLRVPQQQGVQGYWKCVKRETIKGAKEVWKQTGKSPF
ncbi:calcium uptake protein 2, mitochondrial [Crotalus tigris]|uniref:calcium uptake protein 2, mitochondrial n=1 Tax=Crotalus tigris TaxID=88082 RepID=UPI00192F6EDB|nr:calcium uptake protein 2, mitochondrial [Crotalus tigris]XP_039207387.1 calcium uptake protein 2, mitochondrial [Crotalus tigris]XP_039207388.1 calcium uptake protein 2, mitochondrial [Crotalus tigris]XP_039207389.1 calcium uptake protein 2, mitochondrial [Crotalus tigris]XP_039207391.1 calcium uptake protein 2, mitochondrial [Crotalus tigris]